MSTAKRGIKLPKGQRLTVWSVNWGKCRECKTTRRPHAGHGLCTTCRQYHRYHGTFDQFLAGGAK